MISYKEKLQDRRWQRKRLKILQLDDWKCFLCGCTKDEIQLHVHHLEYIKGRDPWDYDDDKLITVCHICHEKLHLGDFSFINKNKFPEIGTVAKDEKGDYFYCAHHTGDFTWMKINPLFAKRWVEND